ncbi:MAG TPA: DHA2 family efflux MFS transporter permease subunit [Kofleriaceae bacterium]|nr:DHA2 family efflux MFS transporter permease subunit [Kofleriaceae bacterium]
MTAMTAGAVPPRAVNKWVVAISIAFGSLMAAIDSSIVGVAMPAIRGELGASLQEMTWVSTAYMIAMVLVMPLTGFLGAVFGQKRFYLVSLIVFVAGSALCGQARSLEALILFRVIQGLGGGALQPTQQAILRQTFPPQEQAMAMALFTMVIMLGPALGPVLGGWITETYHWPWIFYINLPVGLLGIFLTWRNVHEPDDVVAANQARAARMKADFDWAGLGFMTVFVCATQFFFEEGAQQDWFESSQVVVAAFTAVIAGAAFTIRELTAAQPIVNLRLLRDPTFASGTAIATVMFGLLMGSMFLLPIFTQEILRFPATLAGLVLIPRTLAMMVASPIIGRVYNKVAPAWIIAVGVLLFVVGNWQLSHITLDTSSTDLVVPLVVTGFAFACLFVPLTTAALSRIPRHELAEAAGINSFFRQIGGSIGLTVVTTVFTRYTAQATSALRDHVTLLRPEVAAQVAAMHASGLSDAGIVARLQGAVATQGAVLGFEKAFLLQGGTFLLVLPLLLFLRVDRSQPAPKVDVHAE